MPIQWLPLQQRQKTQPRSVVSEALTPRPRPAQGPVGGFAEAGGTMPNKFVEEEKARWAEEDKLRKLERTQRVEEAQEMGMRIRAAYEKEKLGGRQVSAQAAAGRQQAQTAATKQIEANPEPAAKEMYELLKTLPDEMQNILLQQIFTPTEPAGTITSAGETVTMPEKYNAIADVFINKGWATMSAEGEPVLSEPERLFEKGTFEPTDRGILNTATGKILLGTGDIPKGVTPENIADALEWARKTSANYIDPTFLEGLNPERRTALLEMARNSISGFVADYLISVHGLSRKEAERIGNSIPPEEIIPEITTVPPPTTTGRDLPLDEAMAKDIAAHFKATPDADIEAYRDEYGDATVDRALELGEEPKPTVKPTVETPLPYVPSKSEKVPYEHRFRKR